MISGEEETFVDLLATLNVPSVPFPKKKFGSRSKVGSKKRGRDLNLSPGHIPFVFIRYWIVE